MHDLLILLITILLLNEASAEYGKAIKNKFGSEGEW
jgi:hypothetical protein